MASSAKESGFSDMRFLDVCRNPAADGRAGHPTPFLLVVQSDLVQIRRSRVVVPLVRAAAAGTPISRLMPVFEIEGERVVMMTPQIAGISTADIGPIVTSLAEHRLDIRTAIDILTGDL
jgi:toxin CcdB